MSFASLIEGIVNKQNPTVVGFDPQLDFIPEHIKKSAFADCGKNLEGASLAVKRWGFGLVDALCDIVPAIKPQSAFYEQFGWAGMRALNETIAYAREKGMYVIMDAKRGDIGSTMSAYATAWLGTSEPGGEEAFGADSLTVNGYLGSDCINALLPLCDEKERGIFVLVKTSNPSSGELQDKIMDGVTLYEKMGALCEGWGAKTNHAYGYSAVGAVVGATYPKMIEELRRKMPTTMFLVPGYGAQGGSASDVAAAFDAKGLGAVINSSRGIIAAYKKRGRPGEEYAQAAREAAIAMKDDIMKHIPQITL